MPLRILIFIRSDAMRNGGGDHIQAQEYRKALLGLGHKVEISIGPTDRLKAFDVVHVFNTYRVVESLRQLRLAKSLGKAVVLTPIWHSDQLMQHLYRKVYRAPGFLYPFLKPLREWRYLRNHQIPIGWPDLVKYRSSQRDLFERADYVIPNSFAEKRLIEEELAIVLNPCRVIPNTIDNLFRHRSKIRSLKKRSGVLCVGRIEPLKNQISVLKAFSEHGDLHTTIEFIGGLGTHRRYIRKFFNMIDLVPGAIYTEELSREKLARKYFRAQGVIHASYFETTGLVGMEALCNGAALSITDNPYTREYYEGDAHFCDPHDWSSIAEGLDWVVNPKNAKVSYELKSLEETGKTLETVYREIV